MKSTTFFLEERVRVRPISNVAFDRVVRHYAEAHDPSLVGAWKATGGPVNEILHLYRVSSLEDVAGRRAAPGLAQVHSRVVTPALPATEERVSEIASEHPERPRQYIEMTADLAPGLESDAVELIGKALAMQEATGYFTLATAYTTLVGRQGQATAIGLFTHGTPPWDYVAGRPDSPLDEDLRRVAPEESIRLLNPLPYSPLQ